MWALKCDDVVETLAKAAYLTSGGWTRVEDGLPVVPDGLDPKSRIASQVVTLMRQSRMESPLALSPTPEPPRKDRTMIC